MVGSSAFSQQWLWVSPCLHRGAVVTTQTHQMSSRCVGGRMSPQQRCPNHWFRLLIVAAPQLWAAGMCSSAAKHYVIANDFHWAKQGHDSRVRLAAGSLVLQHTATDICSLALRVYSGYISPREMSQFDQYEETSAVNLNILDCGKPRNTNSTQKAPLFDWESNLLALSWQLIL